MGRSGRGRSPNDQRSDSKNPTSAEYKHAMDNRSVQLNPESRINRGSRDSKK